MWDIGGQESLRTSWSTYYVNSRAVILVVDSTDHARIHLSRDELHKMMDHEVSRERQRGRASFLNDVWCLGSTCQTCSLAFLFFLFFFSCSLAPEPGQFACVRQQAGPKERHDVGGDLGRPVTHVAEESSPVAHPGMLRTHRRRVCFFLLSSFID